LHARAASLGSGPPADNSNNHPFVSTDKQVALVHNGKIFEYDALTKKYMVNSRCDSEILLRIFEAGSRDTSIEGRLMGLKDIWSHVVLGHMAVAIGERMPQGERRMWLFRNHFRTLWLLDLRKTLGQMFFCSTPELWLQAMGDCPKLWDHVSRKSKFIEVLPEQLWVFTKRPGAEVENSDIHKFEIKQNGVSLFEYEGTPIAIINKEPTCEVLTDLDHNEEPKNKPTKSFYPKYQKPKKFLPALPLKNPGFHVVDPQKEVENRTLENRLRELDEKCAGLEQTIEDVRTTAWNKMREGSLNKILNDEDSDFEEIIQSITDAQTELAGTLSILENL
jgi:hypothetical protein